MPERTSYEPGTPSWVDLSTPDVDGAKRFYAELFGWEPEDAGPPEETGGYGFFTQGGKRIAGVGPIMTEGQPTVWLTYVASGDAEATVQKARDAGATIHVEPMEVMDAGRMAMFTHPGAGALGVWQAGRHIGAELVNEPVSVAWNELLSRDVDGAKAFLRAVFGIEAGDQDFSGMKYTTLSVNGAGVGGMIAMPAQIPAEVPSFWQTYFAVEDCDAAVARAQELGGSVMMEPMDIEGIGRMAALLDPYGAGFSVIALDRARGG
jgi:predicted enzyme related to lactoylglutathione lyase